jgi:Holliday junction DNA helicase RuvB
MKNVKEQNKEEVWENAIRPNTFESFIGQTDIKDSLSLYVKAAIKRGEALDHVLFYGSPGLGKTTLAKIIANTIGTNFFVTSGAVIEKASDLINSLIRLQKGDVLFIDEIHRLPKSVEEFLYPALEDNAIDIIMGDDKGKSTHRVELAKFTVIGATTRAGMISSPLRERFGIDCRLEFYNELELSYIAKRTASLLGTKIYDKPAELIAKGARGTPRIVNKLVRRCKDYAEVEGNNTISLNAVQETFRMLKIDKNGLNGMDYKILRTILEVYNGGPVGIRAIGSTIDEDAETIETMHEPFLIQNGYIERTSRGRVITAKARKFLIGAEK